MSHAIGRPNLTHSSTSRQQHPYPQPGVARPAQPRTAVASQHTQRLVNDRVLARAKWQRIFAGPAYLDPGPTNRLVLSVRSGVPAEVDFGLERLVQVSSLDPDLLRLVELPGLLDGLAAIIRDYIDGRKAGKKAGVPALASALGEEPREAARRRAVEAALVLRNLSPARGSIEVLAASKRMRKLICDVLEEGNGEGIEAEETTELRLYLLEVLEGIAEKVPLALPGHAITPDVAPDEEDDSRPPPKPEPLDSPAVRLFPLLVALTRCNDRALVLSAFRCLTVLATNNKSDSVFALLTYENIQPLPKPYPHPIQTAIELLPLADAELSTAVLDFIYQHTTLPSNAVLFSTRPELLAVLRLVCSKFHVNGKLESVSIDLRVAKTDAKTWHDALPKRHLRRPLLQGDPDAGLPMSRAEIDSFLPMSEPERCIAWMRLAYEVDPDGDITQVELWQSYQRLFTPLMAPGIPTMLSPSEVIQHAKDGHPTAQPVVAENSDRKFVIKGIKPRDRADLRSRCRCRWTGCPFPASIYSPIAAYHHILDTHLSEALPPSCAWQGCSHAPSNPDPILRRAEFALHIRTHLPPLDASTPRSVDLADLPSILPHERHHSERDPAKGSNLTPAGSVLLSILIIRNIARVAKLALDAKLSSGSSAASSGASTSISNNGGGGGGGGGGTSVASGNAAIGRLAGDEQSIFEAFAAAAEGLAKKDGVLSRLEKVDYTQALPAVEVLLTLEEPLVRMVMSDVALGKVLGEVAQLIEYCGRTASRLGKEQQKTLEGATDVQMGNA